MTTLNNQLLGALVGLSRASESKEISPSAGAAFVDGLALVHDLKAVEKTPETDTASDRKNEILAMIDRLHEEKALMAPDCAACQYPCGRTFDYDMEEVYDASEALRDAKLQLFRALSTIAIHPQASIPKENRQFLSDALFQISCTYAPEQLDAPISKARSIVTSISDQKK